MASFYKSGFPQIPFVGREEERAFLRARLDEVMAGNGCSVFICASPGIGKTRLALTALEYVEREGGFVLHGKARWRETPYVYEPFLELLKGEPLFVKRQSLPFAIRRSIINAMILIYKSSKLRDWQTKIFASVSNYSKLAITWGEIKL